MKTQVFKHIDILSKLSGKYRSRLLFAAFFWSVFAWSFLSFSPAAKQARDMQHLEQVHSHSVEQLAQFFSFELCDIAFPLDIHTYLVARLHKDIGAISNIHFNKFHEEGSRAFLSIEFTSKFPGTNKEFLSNGYLVTEKSGECFGIIY